MPLYIPLTAVLALSGLLMLALHLLFGSPRSDGLKVRGPRHSKLDRGHVNRTVAGNGAFSAMVVFALCFGFYDKLFYEGGVGLLGGLWEVVATIMLYDFLYYWLHRGPFHAWSVLKAVHTVHHKVRYPSAFESLYLHPIETFLGIALLMLCTWVVGPVSVASFAVIFLIYSSLNILVHCGLRLPIVGFMTRKHDRHHQSMRAGNFASITPLPDIVFGTVE